MKQGKLAVLLAVAVMLMAMLALASVAWAQTASGGQSVPDRNTSQIAQAQVAECTSGSDFCVPDGFIDFVFSEDDPSAPCTFNETVDWGDNTVEQFPNVQDGHVASHQYANPGVYTVRFTGNASSSDPNVTCTYNSATFTVEFPAPNQPPDGSFTYTIDSNNPMLVHFHATGTDPEGGPLKYSWIFGDNFSTNCLDSPDANHTYSRHGTYTVRLIVCDDHGNTDPTPATRTITLKPTTSAGGNGGPPPGAGPPAGQGPAAGPGPPPLPPGGGGGNASRYHSALGPPTIRDVRTEDPDSNGQASVKDVMRFIFNESMDKSTGANGSSFRVSDADGTTADITCGTAARCDLIAGSGTAGGFAIRQDQVMLVRLRTTPQPSSLVQPGTVPGLQYPLTIIAVNSEFKDRGGAQLDLSGSGDHTIEVVESVLDFESQ